MVGNAVRARTAIGVLALAATVACGGQPTAGPSPVATAPSPGTVSAPAASLLPATFDRAAVAALGLDADYVRKLAYVLLNSDGSEQLEHQLERWEGGPMVFCAEPGIDLGAVARVADDVHAATGLPTSVGDAGCNVRWTLAEAGHSYADRVFSGRAILSARLIFVGGARAASFEGLHEVGHVLGLGHSTRPEDAMSITPEVARFSPAETSLLRAMYGRRP